MWRLSDGHRYLAHHGHALYLHAIVHVYATVIRSVALASSGGTMPLNFHDRFNTNIRHLNP